LLNLSTRTRLASLALACFGAIAAAAAAWCAAPAASGAGALPPRALADAASPYLREAAAGAIRWQPWSAASFALARKLGRPVLIDIGADWCHWCHVMDQSTYADPKVIELINSDFVPIKVDTDERPGVDSYYQSAAQAFSAGGWPLTVFATPDGAPLLITGYLPPHGAGGEPRAYGMADVLERVAEAYRRDPRAAQFAHDLARKLAAPASVATGAGMTPAGLEERIAASLERAYDRSSGGFFSAGARFYDFPALRFAMARGFYGHPHFTALALASLRKIAAGGVYDQLGGGFHRYSTDSQWRVPHFEKMGYDQAMAIRAYAEAYELSRDPRFAAITRSIVGYVNGTLLDPGTHAFYASQSADAFPGDDGSYYTWTVAEIKRVLTPAEARAAMLYFGISADPAHAPDGRIVLRRATAPAAVATKLKIPAARVAALLASAEKKMLAARERRRAPAVDHSILADRNALMASAYLTAAAALDDPRLSQSALADLDFILTHMRAPGGGFYHVWSRGRASVLGVAADQVYLADALIDAYQATGGAKYLREARKLAAIIATEYSDPKSGLVHNRDVAVAGTVVAPQAVDAQVLYDNPTPSVQASAAVVMMKLGAITSDPGYAKLAVKLLASAPAMANDSSGESLGTVALVLERRNRETIIAVAADANDRRADVLLDTALAAYRPGKVVIHVDRASARTGQLPQAMAAMYRAAAKDQGPLAFVCTGTACANPSHTPAGLAHTLKTFAVPAPSAESREVKISP
jgi:uncharacterized protein YyaL (SSP411 family)